MATLIDTLLVSLKLDSGDFKRDADNAMRANKDLADSTKKATAEYDEFAKSVNNGIKALAGVLHNKIRSIRLLFPAKVVSLFHFLY